MIGPVIRVDFGVLIFQNWSGQDTSETMMSDVIYVNVEVPLLSAHSMPDNLLCGIHLPLLNLSYFTCVRMCNNLW